MSTTRNFIRHKAWYLFKALLFVLDTHSLLNTPTYLLDTCSNASLTFQIHLWNFIRHEAWYLYKYLYKALLFVSDNQTPTLFLPHPHTCWTHVQMHPLTFQMQGTLWTGIYVQLSITHTLKNITELMKNLRSKI